MLSKILSNLATDAKQVYETVYCLAEIISDGSGRKQPKVYEKDGQLLNASDFDSKNGMGYFRHDGDLRLDHVAIKEQITSCSEALLFQYPMKFVGAVPKSKFTDNAFTNDNIVLRLITLLEKKHVLDNDAKIAYEVVIDRASTDGIRIIAEEYSGFDLQQFNYNLSYVAVYFTLRIGADKACLPECID